MTNREMAIRFAAGVIEQMLKHNNTNAEEALKVLRAEIEVFDLIQEMNESK
jgi:hypothetical protein